MTQAQISLEEVDWMLIVNLTSTHYAAIKTLHTCKAFIDEAWENILPGMHKLSASALSASTRVRTECDNGAAEDGVKEGFSTDMNFADEEGQYHTADWLYCSRCLEFAATLNTDLLLALLGCHHGVMQVQMAHNFLLQTALASLLLLTVVSTADLKGASAMPMLWLLAENCWRDGGQHLEQQNRSKQQRHSSGHARALQLLARPQCLLGDRLRHL